MSLFERLIIEVDTPAYQIGLLSRYRIRAHVYSARSSEISRLNHLHGKAVIDQTLKVPDLILGDHVTSADRQEGDITERKRRREDHESSAQVRKTRRDTLKPSRGLTSIRDGLNVYWVDGAGIHREVLQEYTCQFLGPEARSRPLTYNVQCCPFRSTRLH